jgi:hypothetical protein
MVEHHQQWFSADTTHTCLPAPCSMFMQWSYKFGDLVQMVRLHYEAQCGSDVRWFPWWYW